MAGRRLRPEPRRRGGGERARLPDAALIQDGRSWSGSSLAQSRRDRAGADRLAGDGAALGQKPSLEGARSSRCAGCRLSLLESAAATLGLAAGVVTVLLVFRHRRAGNCGHDSRRRAGLRGNALRGARDARSRLAQGDWLAASAQHRIEIWDFSVQRIAERPLLGWGFDGSRHMQELFPGLGGTGRELAALHPHSAPLQIVLELGAVGAVIVLGLLGLIACELTAKPPGHGYSGSPSSSRPWPSPPCRTARGRTGGSPWWFPPRSWCR